MKKNRSVLRPVSVSIFAMLTLITSAICFWIWRDVKEKCFTDLTNTASVLKRYNEFSFLQRELALISVGTRMMDVSGPSSDSLRLRIGLDAIKIYDEFLAFGLTRTDGSMITFTGNTQATGVPNLMNSSHTRRSFLYAKNRKRISIGEPYYFNQVDDWILPVRVTLYDGDSLTALNTSAIQYSSLNDDLTNFGFNPLYRIHVIHSAFNTTQFYYPLELDRYDSLLQKDAGIYRNFEILNIKNSVEQIEGFNSYENYPIIGVRLNAASLDQTFIVSVNKNLLVHSFWDRSQYVFLVYLILVAISAFGVAYLTRKERRHKAELQIGKANLDSLFESTNSIIGLFDNEKKLIEFNRSFAEYAKNIDGIDLEIGMDVLDQMKNEEMANLFRKYQDRALHGEKFTETVKYPVEDKHLYFQLSYNPIYRDNEVTGISMFVDDITELKNSQAELETYSKKLEELVNERTKELKSANTELTKTNVDLSEVLENLEEAQDRLIQAEKMASLGVLAAGVGHEINNPLNFIQGGLTALINALEEDNVKKADLDIYLNAIEEGVKRCSAITESLSNYSRQGGDMHESCHIQGILDNCLLILNSKMKSKIEIDKQYDTEDVIVIGNEGKLHQVFLNILTNAEQAITDKGKISINCHRAGENVEICIRDTGDGIKKSDLKKISDPFFTTKAPGEGTGLGLSIAYSIVEEHGGSITCTSKIRMGTEFSIKLPIAQPDSNISTNQ